MIQTKYSYVVILTFFLLIVNHNSIQGQSNQDNFFDYDELLVVLNVQKLGFYNIDAVYYNDNLYLPIMDLFNKLGIYVWHSASIDTISGYILNEDNSYALNVNTRQLVFRNKEIFLEKEQIISNFSDVFLPLGVYEKVFGFSLKLDFRTLTVHLSSDVELPVIKQLRIERMRANIRALTGEISVDTTFHRKMNWIGGAAIDWNLQLNQEKNGSNSQQLRTALGLELLGGELVYRTQVINDSLLKMGNQYAKWRYINDNNKLVRQIELGNITPSLFSQTTTSFYGVKISNTPVSFKRTYGTYYIQKKTNPGWEVELYINNNLIDFKTADANGDFSFEIPLVFGNSKIELKYYGPWGEEHEEEIFINIPFNFTPHKQIEYQVFSGISADTSAYFFNHSKISYGLNRRITLTAGYEHFDGNLKDKNIWFASANLVAGKNTLFNYTYVDKGMHSMAMLTRTKSNLVIDGKYRKFFPEQSIIPTTNTAETELGLNYPLVNRKLKITLRSAGRVNFNKAGNSLMNESSLAFFYRRMNLGLTSISSISQTNNTYMGLNSSFSFKNSWTVYLHALSDVSDFKPNTRIQVQKRFNNKIFAGTSYAYDFEKKEYLFNLSLFMDLSSVRTSSITNIQKEKISAAQNLGGSVNITRSPAPVFLSNRNSVGRGGVDVLVFLDINHNGVKDDNEPLIKNATVAINRGQRVMHSNDSVHRFIALEPYAQHVITAANAGFPYISWILEQSTVAFYPSPNQIKKIYIPVKPMGEIETRVLIRKDNKDIPAGRIILYIFDKNNKLINRGLTEQDGYFFYMGLAPGKYKIKFDNNQLESLNLIYDEQFYEFEIKESIEGDYVESTIILMQKND